MTQSSNQKVFNNKYIFHGWIWGSGTGSIYIFNKPFVKFINKFLEDHNDIHTVVDIGCGDWQIGKHFDLANRKYIGCDVSDYIIKKTKAKFASANREFLHLDAISDELPKGDLVICKDVMQHLCNRDIHCLLSKISIFRYIIIKNDIYDTQNFSSVNDIRNGKFRHIDVTQFDKRYRCGN